MAALLVNQSQDIAIAVGTTTTITPPAITAGNSLILLFTHSGGASGTLTSVADSGNTWTLPDPPRGGISGIGFTYLAAAYVHNAVAPGTITVTTNSVGNKQVVVLEVSGLQNAVPDIAAEDFTNAANTTTIVSATGTTTQVGDFVVGFANYGGTVNTSGVSSGWTALTQPPAAGNNHLSSAYKIGTSATSEQASFTGLSTGVRTSGGLMAFKATAGVVTNTTDFFQMF